ncbi:MAG: hypothetical protein J3R72DRAFT_486791 [Linnemannia gamsii]|nr:MAG: hypothetical protein J3R72DRAFT_486791 [Linnemannia gamsii]
MTTSDFMMLFSECPNIETLGVPWAGSQTDQVALGLYIGKMCSKLRHVQPSHIRDDYQLSVTITSTMAPNTLQGLSTYDYSLDVPSMSTILERHSPCLRIVKMEGYVHLTSALIRQVLVHCSALEELRLNRFSAYTAALTLADATAERWASNRIKYLQLQEGEYFNRPEPLVLTDAEREQFELLTKLYTQIGRQRMMEILDLVAVPEATSVKAKATGFVFPAFPAMLSLGTWGSGGCPGYLHLLRGLTRLRKLIGSFEMYSDETVLTVGQAEVEFMLQHWERLENVHFYSRRVPFRPCFQYMQDERPNLSLYHYR